jgi:hypothetical protein
MAAIRALIITPFVLQWYPFLTRLCPGPSVWRVMGRVAVDQSIGAPIVISMVFTANAVLNREVSSLGQRLREQLLVTWAAGLRYWPVVHSITFGLVPLQHQPLFAHVASVYWNAVLSYYANLHRHSSTEGEDKRAAKAS